MDKICVLGLGYIGLPTALLFATNNTKVVGIDINEKIVKNLNKGKLNFVEKGLQSLLDKALELNTFEASTEVQVADVYIICVPTPLDKVYHVADLEYVTSACKMILPKLKKGNLVIIESTISPGSSTNLFQKTLEQTGLVEGKDFYLVYCPERAIPGNTIEEMINNHRIIGGLSTEGTEKAKKMYTRFVTKDKIHCTNIKIAETVKLMENSFRDINIALANEFAMISEELGIDVWEAIKLANLHPRVDILNPGPGVGGHCIAIDPWFLAESSFSAQLIKLSRMINDSMPYYVLTLTKKLLQDNIHYPIVITVFGLSYKANVDDIRGSPALKFINLAEKSSFKVKIYDPIIQQFNKTKLLSLEESVKDSDCIVLIADHEIFTNVDPIHIGKLMRNKNLIDTRNHLDLYKWKDAGFNVKILGINKV